VSALDSRSANQFVNASTLQGSAGSSESPTA
jgi:hypothetical protein